MSEVEELREVVREAHAAIKDLRHLLREVKEERTALTTLLREGIEEEIDGMLTVGLASLNSGFSTAIEDATARVYARFDTMGDILLGEDWKSKAEGKASLIELMEKAIENAEPSFREAIG